MMSNSISNVTIDTVCHNVPLAARSSRKAENAPDIPPATVFAQAAPPQQANGKDTRTKSVATKNGGIPDVPPLSDYTRRYLDWDLSTTVASYVARLTTEVRSFREWFARANDTAVAREILDGFFHEVKEFEDTYQGRKAALGLSQDTKGHINNEDANYSARDDVDNSKLSDDGATDDDEEDVHEELFDSLHVEETLEHGDMSIVDDNDLHFKVVYRTSSPADIEQTEDHLDNCEVSVKREPVDVDLSFDSVNAIDAKELDTSAWPHTREEPFELPPRIAPDWITDDDGYEASISSDSSEDWRSDAPPRKNVMSYPPAPIKPATAAPSLVPLGAACNLPMHMECPRTSITGLFRELPAPFFEALWEDEEWATLDTAHGVQAISPATRQAHEGVHRSEGHLQRARSDGPYRQHYLRHSSVSRGERMRSPERVQRNLTAPNLASHGRA